MVYFGKHATTICIVLQVMAVGVGFAVLSVWPPREGEILLVPIGETAAMGMISAAVTEHATLIGVGPLPHSYVVRGNRSRLARVMLSRGIVLFSASAAGCGEAQVTA